METLKVERKALSQGERHLRLSVNASLFWLRYPAFLVDQEQPVHLIKLLVYEQL
jgi:hypothetical protein